MTYDKDAILAVAEPLMIAQYVGIETRRRGANTFIRCPSHEKNLGKADRNIGNCVLTKTGFKCFSCGAYGDVFDLVQAYTNCSYPDALETVGNACGGASKFNNKTAYKSKQNFLSSSDQALIGLCPTHNPETSDAGRELFNCDQKKREDTEKIGCTRRGEEYLLYKKTVRPMLLDLYNQKPLDYYRLVAQKAAEAKSRYQQKISEYSSPSPQKKHEIELLFGSASDEVLNNILSALRKKRKRAEEIQKEFNQFLQQNQS